MTGHTPEPSDAQILKHIARLLEDQGFCDAASEIARISDDFECLAKACAGIPTEQLGDVGALVDALCLAKRMVNEALPKFNWGDSTLDAEAITLLNETDIAINAALAPFRKD